MGSFRKGKVGILNIYGMSLSPSIAVQEMFIR